MLDSDDETFLAFIALSKDLRLAAKAFTFLIGFLAFVAYLLKAAVDFIPIELVVFSKASKSLSNLSTEELADLESSVMLIGISDILDP